MRSSGGYWFGLPAAGPNSKLSGVTDFAIADLMDPASLQRALTAEPRAVWQSTDSR